MPRHLRATDDPEQPTESKRPGPTTRFDRYNHTSLPRRLSQQIQKLSLGEMVEKEIRNYGIRTLRIAVVEPIEDIRCDNFRSPSQFFKAAPRHGGDDVLPVHQHRCRAPEIWRKPLRHPQ